MVVSTQLKQRQLAKAVGTVVLLGTKYLHEHEGATV